MDDILSALRAVWPPVRWLLEMALCAVMLLVGVAVAGFFGISPTQPVPLWAAVVGGGLLVRWCRRSINRFGDAATGDMGDLMVRIQRLEGK